MLRTSSESACVYSFFVKKLRRLSTPAELFRRFVETCVVPLMLYCSPTMRFADDDLFSKSDTLSFRPDYYSRVARTLLISRYARRRRIFEIWHLITMQGWPELYSFRDMLADDLFSKSDTLSFRPDYYSRVTWALLISRYARRWLIFEIWHFEFSTWLLLKCDLNSTHFLPTISTKKSICNL